MTFRDGTILGAVHKGGREASKSEKVTILHTLCREDGQQSNTLSELMKRFCAHFFQPPP